MTSKNPKKDDLTDETPVEFIASMRDDGKLYTLTVMCEVPLTAKEFAYALDAFAKDIHDGEFKFENDSGDPSIFEQ